jgi:hypothetical protein
MRPTSPRSPYFVLAHHRSGSNFLNDLLQSHPRIECINEPLSMHTGHFRDCDLAPWSGAEFDPDVLHPSLASHESLRSYLLDFREYLCQSSSSRVIGFKDTVLFGKLDWLKAFVPSLKVLFLKRDPRSIVSSLLRSGLLEFWNYAALVPPAFEKLHPHYTGARESIDPAIKVAELAAMSVALRYELAHRSIGAFEHKVLHLDELMRKPEECLTAVANFLGVESNQAQLSFIRDRQASSRGGAFSSFRTQEDVENRWQRHLKPEQIRVIENVLHAAGTERLGSE